MLGSRSARLEATLRSIVQGQQAVTDRLDRRDTAAARELHALVEGAVAEARQAWPLEPEVLNLAGYHHKNAYMLDHWAAIQAGRPPRDSLLNAPSAASSRRCLVDPDDCSALNGLGSVLVFERELDAAEFFIGRALALAEAQGMDYAAARHDLALVRGARRG